MKKSIFTLAGLFMLLVASPAFAAPPAPGADPDAPPVVPIDKGLSLLIAAGVLYGAKKANDRRKL